MDQRKTTGFVLVLQKDEIFLTDEINKGGHDRFCTFCYEENKTKVMGDEVHAILNCTHFNDIRERFLHKIDLMVPYFLKKLMIKIN